MYTIDLHNTSPVGIYIIVLSSNELTFLPGHSKITLEHVYESQIKEYGRTYARQCVVVENIRKEGKKGKVND